MGESRRRLILEMVKAGRITIEEADILFGREDPEVKVHRKDPRVRLDAETLGPGPPTIPFERGHW